MRSSTGAGVLAAGTALVLAGLSPATGARAESGPSTDGSPQAVHAVAVKQKKLGGSSAKHWWGLPTFVAPDDRPVNRPMKYPASLYAGLERTNSTPKTLGGYRMDGVKVKRESGFRFRPMTRSGWKDRRIHVPIVVHSSVTGTHREKAVQKVAVVLMVKNFSKTRWVDVKAKGVTKATANFELPRGLAREVSTWSASKVRKQIVARAVQVLDVDNVTYQWRRTADVVKLHGTTYGQTRANAANITVNPKIALTNNDFVTFDNTWAAPNLVATANSCMQKVKDGDDLWNITGSTPGQVVQAAFPNNSALKQPANEAPAGEDVWHAMVEDIGEAVVETYLGEPQKATSALYDAIEEVGELMLGDCNENPGLYSLSAADANGNSTIQGYTSFQPWNDATGLNNWDGDAPGGVADIQSAVNILNAFAGGACWHGSRPEPECGPFQFAAEANRAASYIENSYLPNSGSGFGDFGLAMQIQPGPNGAAEASTYSGSGQSDNAVIDLQLNWNQGCSSTFGGVVSDATPYPPPSKGFWTNVIGGYNQVPCPPQSNPGNAIFTPVNDGPPSISYPGMASGAAASPGTVLTVSNGDWTNNPSSFTYNWYSGSGTLLGTGNTFTVPATMPNQTVYATVTAANTAGATGTTSTPARSNLQTIADEAAPTAVTLPELTSGGVEYDSVNPGQPITASTGTWNSYQQGGTLSYTYAWFECATPQLVESQCVALEYSYPSSGTVQITPQMNTVYPNRRMIQSYVVAQVTATDQWGSTTATAGNAIEVNGYLVPDPQPQISVKGVGPAPFRGWAEEEVFEPTWTVSTGTWPTVEGGLTYTYEWWICQKLSGTYCQQDAIMVGTGQELSYDSIDLPQRYGNNFWVSAVVIATTLDGLQSIAPATAAFYVVNDSYIVTQAPTITAQQVTGATGTLTQYTVNSAVWAPNNINFTPTTQPTSYGYQWYACADAACNLNELLPIRGQTGSTYTPTGPKTLIEGGQEITAWGLVAFQYAYNDEEFQPTLVNMDYTAPVQYGPFS